MASCEIVKGEDDKSAEVEVKMTTSPPTTEYLFKVKKTTQLKRIFVAFGKQLGIDPSTRRFLIDEDRLHVESLMTVEELAMKHNGGDFDINICAYLDQLGGRYASCYVTREK